MAYALLLDAILQFTAGVLDLRANKIPQKLNTSQKVLDNLNAINDGNESQHWSRKLAVSVMLITIGVQVIIFNLAHQVPSNFSPFMLAIFYLGAAHFIFNL
ncbi:MAG TPA: hypothetical protein VHM20_02375 [Gammaproteobacteria bacterium]|jgi:hypothetical protein|nr:hypothetical protein [Gammaproteobacteria bacterium]